MAFTENLDIFLNVGDFAVPVTVTLPGPSTVTFNAIFDSPFMDASLGEIVLDTTAPTLTCKMTDALFNGAYLPRGTAIVVNAGNYSVLEVKPEGTGMAIIRLAIEP